MLGFRLIQITMVKLNFDGGSNKEFLTYGWVLQDDGVELAKGGGKLPKYGLSSNVAEYAALIIGLTEAIKRGVKVIEVYGDSQLVIYQLNGKYKVKSEWLRPCNVIVKALVQQFETITIYWVPRTENIIADREGRG